MNRMGTFRGGTQTEVEYTEFPPHLPPAASSTKQRSAPLILHPEKPGRPLGGNNPPRKFSARPISDEWEEQVKARLQALLFDEDIEDMDILEEQDESLPMFDRIRNLEQRVQSFLKDFPSKEQNAFNKWKEVFHSTDPQDEEGLAYAISILLFEVIAPLSNADSESPSVKWSSEVFCMLTQLFPENEKFELFLKDTAKGLLELKVLEAKSLFAKQAMEAQQAAITQVMDDERAQIDATLHWFKTRMNQFHQQRESDHQVIENEINATRDQIASLQKDLKAGADAAQKVVEQYSVLHEFMRVS